MIRRSHSETSLLFYPEIERFARENRRKRREEQAMADNRRTIGDFIMPSITNESGGIVVPEVTNQHF